MTVLAPPRERYSQGVTRDVDARGPDPNATTSLIDSYVNAPRVIRLKHNLAGKLIPARYVLSNDGSEQTRQVDVPDWGLAIGVPGGTLRVEVFGAPAVKATWQAMLSIGAPVIEHVPVLVPQVATTLQPPLYARSVQAMSFGAAPRNITLPSGIVVPLGATPTLLIAQPLTLLAVPATETQVLWEVYS